MAKLNTYLPLEVVQSNKKLWEIECDDIYYYSELGNEWNIEHDSIPKPDTMNIEDASYPASTIADIIDNAEKLFGNKKCRQDNSWRFTATDLLVMAWDNKSIEQISKYITDNLK